MAFYAGWQNQRLVALLEIYVGALTYALTYADDIALLAPTTWAMRLMLGICDDFAQEYAIVFNAKKSKCLWVKHSSAIKVASDRKPQFVIGASVIEFADSWPQICTVFNDPFLEGIRFG